MTASASDEPMRPASGSVPSPHLLLAEALRKEAARTLVHDQTLRLTFEMKLDPAKRSLTLVHIDGPDGMSADPTHLAILNELARSAALMIDDSGARDDAIESIIDSQPISHIRMWTSQQEQRAHTALGWLEEIKEQMNDHCPEFRIETRGVAIPTSGPAERAYALSRAQSPKEIYPILWGIRSEMLKETKSPS